MKQKLIRMQKAAAIVSKGAILTIVTQVAAAKKVQRTDVYTVVHASNRRSTYVLIAFLFADGKLHIIVSGKRKADSAFEEENRTNLRTHVSWARRDSSVRS